MSKTNTQVEQNFWSVLKQCFSLRNSYKSLFHPKHSGFASLDGWRVIGMLWVIMGHSMAVCANVFAEATKQPVLDVLNQSPSYITLFTNAHYMVDLFFVLSGFLIASILYREYDKYDQVRYKHFYYRRFMRLMPTYIFVVLIFCLAGVPGRENAWQNLLYINNFFPHKETFLPWTWSLAVEEQFYLLFPVLLTLFFARHGRFISSLFVLFIISFVIRWWIVNHYSFLANDQMWTIHTNPEYGTTLLNSLYDNLYTRYGGFLCGIYVAYLYRYKKTQLEYFINQSIIGRLTIGLCVMIGILLLSITWTKSYTFPTWFIEFFQVSNRNIFCIVMTVVLTAVIFNHKGLNYFNKLLKWKKFYPYAQLTYSAYLVHLPIVAGVGFVSKRILFDFPANSAHPPVAYVLLTFSIACFFTYLLSIAIYLFLEKPLMNYRDHVSGRSYRDIAKQ